MKGLRIAACFSFVSLSLLMIALTSDYWIVASDGRAYGGLWQECEDALCVSYGVDVPGYIQVTRDFLLLGMVAGTVSFFGFCASFFQTHIGSFSTKRLAVWACFAAGVYNDQIVVYGTWFGWSFGIGWASFILFLITGGLAYKTVGSTA
ncbi:protein NKG7-like isoform X2 [Heteronotia binoei]|uniref:protein NKG7-like isoform X2 n=1 Tax=Heteronotia binoei TaxID=13085 RepID=UPI0029307CFA|nr:protein NKG7-like isoform X2 [Heteronotia binoei]